ncbi:uracil-DNA glycosylase [Oceaniglobus indicus]|uniref:uracil-DNA glycosylase n=1 Tax=Oceaniglobus indicus TaxID=2047749 RepID=UPI000C19F06C|nr:uracil-DNA glycosylase [Oceaniglobus indicus]
MIDDFLDLLVRTPAPPGCANPYTIHEPAVDATPDAPTIRLRQLRGYLERRMGQTDLVLVAEAPGYQGARFSGIAMTCERTLLGLKPAVPAELVLAPGTPVTRTSRPETGRNKPERAGGFSEPTASCVWGEMIRHGISDRTVLWNVFPFHPRKGDDPLTNRTPTGTEVADHLHILTAMLDLLGQPRIVCIGRTSQNHLAASHPYAPAIRHPANGGVPKFREGLAEVIAARG